MLTLNCFHADWCRWFYEMDGRRCNFGTPVRWVLVSQPRTVCTVAPGWRVSRNFSHTYGSTWRSYAMEIQRTSHQHKGMSIAEADCAVCWCAFSLAVESVMVIAVLRYACCLVWYCCPAKLLRRPREDRIFQYFARRSSCEMRLGRISTLQHTQRTRLGFCRVIRCTMTS